LEIIRFSTGIKPVIALELVDVTVLDDSTVKELLSSVEVVVVVKVVVDGSTEDESVVVEKVSSGGVGGASTEHPYAIPRMLLIARAKHIHAVFISSFLLKIYGNVYFTISKSSK